MGLMQPLALLSFPPLDKKTKMPADTADVLYREMPIVLVKREVPAGTKPDPNALRFSVSSETPVMRGEDTEILRHDAACVDLNRLRNLGCALVNHDPNQRAAAIMSAEIINNRLEVDVRFGSTEFAQDVLRDVNDGLLRGISIGYRVSKWELGENRTYTATKWEPFEVTFTPIPADATVGVGRSVSESWQALTRSLTSNTRAAIPAAPSKDSTMPENTQPATPAPAPQAPAVVPANPIHDESVRAAAVQETREIAQMAESVGLSPTAFIGMRKAEASAAIIVAMAERNKTAEPKSVAVSMTADHVDKQRDAVAEAYMVRVGMAKPSNGNPYIGHKVRDMAKIYARESGIRGANDWKDKDSAHFALGEYSQVSNFRDAPNITTGNFTNFVMLNAMTKITAKGFEMAQKGLVGPSGAPIYDTQKVPDFKTYYIGGLGTGNFQQTAEGIAFPELTKTEGSYSDTAKMWGGTLSLTLQALISDDTGAFDRSLRQIGPIAQKTIDSRLITKFLCGTSTSVGTSTFTSNTTSGCTPVFTTADTIAAARANVGKGPAALMAKTGLDGNPLANMTRFLLAGPTAGLYLGALLGQAPGQTVQNAGQFELVVTPWLEASSITGNSTTSYYAVSDPAVVTGLILNLITGYESPQVQEYDAGAVGARKWKFWMPMEADLFWFTTTDGSTKVIPGVQQCTT